MVIKNRLRFFVFFFSFVFVLFLSVKSCVKVKPSKYVEVEADKVSPVPKKIENTQSLVNFIEEVKESNQKQEEEEEALSVAEIESREKDLQARNYKELQKDMQFDKKKTQTAKIKKSVIVDKKKASSSRLNAKKTVKKRKATPLRGNQQNPTYNTRTPNDIVVSGGERALNGYSRAKLESYASRVKFSLAKKVYITGYYLGSEPKVKGFARAEKVKSILIGSGLRNKTIYVFSKKSSRNPSSVNFDWSKISAKN